MTGLGIPSPSYIHSYDERFILVGSVANYVGNNFSCCARIHIPVRRDLLQADRNDPKLGQLGGRQPTEVMNILHSIGLLGTFVTAVFVLVLWMEQRFGSRPARFSIIGESDGPSRATMGGPDGKSPTLSSRCGEKDATRLDRILMIVPIPFRIPREPEN